MFVYYCFNLVVITLLVLANNGSSKTPCYNVVWHPFADQHAYGATIHFNTTSTKACLDWCLTDVSCVGVDVDDTHSPVDCWVHYDIAEFRDLYDESGIDSYQLQCDNVEIPSVSYNSQLWDRQNETAYVGAPLRFEVSRVDDCLSWCLWNTSCVAVDVEYNVHPVICWCHNNASLIAESNRYPLIGTTHYGLKERLPDIVSSGSSIATVTASSLAKSATDLSGAMTFPMSGIVISTPLTSRTSTSTTATTTAAAGSVTSIWPLYGPVVGDTRVTVSGHSLDIASIVIDNVSAVIDTSSSGGTLVNISGSDLNSVAMPLILLTTITRSNDSITSQRITSTESCFIPAGVTDGSLMTCRMPDVNLPSDLLNQSALTMSSTPGSGVAALTSSNSLVHYRVDVFIGLHFDGLTAYDNISAPPAGRLNDVTMQFYAKPILNCTTQIYNNSRGNGYIQIEGSDLLRAGRVTDYNITVGDEQCAIVELTDSHVIVRPPINRPITGSDTTCPGIYSYEIQVTVGNAHYSCGCLTYSAAATPLPQPSSSSTSASSTTPSAVVSASMSDPLNLPLIIGLTAGLGGAFLIALIIIIALLIVICVRKSRARKSEFALDHHPLASYIFRLPYNRPRDRGGSGGGTLMMSDSSSTTSTIQRVDDVCCDPDNSGGNTMPTW